MQLIHWVNQLHCMDAHWILFEWLLQYNLSQLLNEEKLLVLQIQILTIFYLYHLSVRLVVNHEQLHEDAFNQHSLLLQYLRFASNLIKTKYYYLLLVCLLNLKLLLKFCLQFNLKDNDVFCLWKWCLPHKKGMIWVWHRNFEDLWFYRSKHIFRQERWVVFANLLV